MSARRPMVMKGVRVPEQLWADALRIAEERDETVSDIVRAALERYVKRYGRTEP